MNDTKLKQLQNTLKYKFKNQEFLKQALIHRSCLNQAKYSQSNERMEFLGDAVLELLISHHLYSSLKDSPEGILTANRSAIVRTESLALIAKQLDLGQHIIMSKGEESGGGRQNQSLLANTTEAVTGAIYLDGGFTAAKNFVNHHIIPQVRELIKNNPLKDNKSKLQEVVQSQGFDSPVYKQVKAEGPDHSKTFTVAVLIGNKQKAQGTGKNKQQAQQNAAHKALKLMYNNKIHAKN